mmetsp:Transcript_35630/g.40590  ORF Transcript_35630/g.40590 Transcript_35630/m.40590 type:complete len:88 (+) Transcript_35630:1327-1590(+)
MAVAGGGRGLPKDCLGGRGGGGLLGGGGFGLDTSPFGGGGLIGGPFGGGGLAGGGGAIAAMPFAHANRNCQQSYHWIQVVNFNEKSQ